MATAGRTGWRQLWFQAADKGAMPRRARHLTVIPGHPHHLVLRGNNRRRLFSYQLEHTFFLRRMVNGSRELGVPVHTTVLMSNHVHLIVTPTDHHQLGRFVGSFAQPYAQFRNRRRGSSGKLFEERYRCIPIRSEEQMTITTAYIELNPVRAGLCSEPGDYRWSTYSLHAGHDGSDPLISRLWTPSSWYLSLGCAPIDRSAAYRDWFEHYRARDEWSDVYRDPPQKRGGKRFERPDRRRAL